MPARGFCSITTVVLTCTIACGSDSAPSPPPRPESSTVASKVGSDLEAKAEIKAAPPRDLEAKVETKAEPDPTPPEPPPSLAIGYPFPRSFRNGAVAATVGPFADPRRYCAAYSRTAPPRQQLNPQITIDSECKVLRGSSSYAELLPAKPLPALGPPYLEVVLIRTVVPHDSEEGKEEDWDRYEEIRVAVVTERGAFVEERGIEIAEWLPASAVTLRSATVGDVVAGGEPELRVTLELFIGADEGVPEQYQAFELVCGFGGSGAFGCARFESQVSQSEAPRSPVTEEALGRIVLP
jgi:hypothetical protein